MSATARPATALADSVVRVGGLQNRCELRTDLPGSWQRCAAFLTDPARFDVWRKLLAEWLRERFGEAPPRTTAGYVMSWYLHVPAYAGALLLHHERRVPSLGPRELAFRLGGERPHPDGIAVLGKDFCCLPSDPGAALPQATVVAGEQALAAVFRARYVAHATRFVRAYAQVSGLGRRMLWAAATDALDNALWWAGQQGGDEAAGAADAALVLDARYEPLTSPSSLRLGADLRWSRRRESCCFSYLLPGESECAECPRIRPRQVNLTTSDRGSRPAGTERIVLTARGDKEMFSAMDELSAKCAPPAGAPPRLWKRLLEAPESPE